MRKFIVLLIAIAALVPASLGQSSDPGAGGAGAASAQIVAKKASDTVSLPYDGGRVRYLASKEETGGDLSVVEIIESAGYKTPLHRHPDGDEAFYVLEGVLTAKIGDRKPQEFGPGSFVLIPRGTVHAQGNFEKAPVRLLVLVLPGGFEQFFADRVELFKNLKPGDPEFEKQIKAVIEKNHIEVVGTWER